MTAPHNGLYAATSDLIPVEVGDFAAPPCVPSERRGLRKQCFDPTSGRAHSDTLGLEFLLVPAWFAETFAIDDANAASWRAQKDQLLALDSLRLVVTALQDSITGLVAANATAYQAGYQAAYAGFQDLSQRYVAELRKPRIRLGSALGIVAAAGVGILVGRAIP